MNRREPRRHRVLKGRAQRGPQAHVDGWAVRRAVGAPVVAALLAALVSVTVAASGCSGAAQPGPADVVEGLLEARSAGATDPAEYLRFVEATSVAEALML